MKITLIDMPPFDLPYRIGTSHTDGMTTARALARSAMTERLQKQPRGFESLPINDEGKAPAANAAGVSNDVADDCIKTSISGRAVKSPILLAIEMSEFLWHFPSLRSRKKFAYIAGDGNE